MSRVRSVNLCQYQRSNRGANEIRSLYRDESDLFRTVLKRIYEEWNAELEQWHLKRIEFIYEDPEFPVPSDNPAVAVEQRHGWLIPPAWEFVSFFTFLSIFCTFFAKNMSL